MKVFNDEASLALAKLSVDQLVRTKGSSSAADGQSVLWRISASGDGIVLANGNVAVPIVNDKSGRKNLIINGDFRIWQRGTTGFSGVVYTADRALGLANRTYDQSSDTFLGDGYSLLINATAGAPAVYLSVELDVDGERGPLLANTDYTFSFDIKTDNAADIQARVAFVNSVGSSTDRVDIFALASIGTADGNWQRHSVTFNTGSIVPNVNNKAIEIIIITDITLGTARVDKAQLEQGPVATEFEYRPIAEELALCQRYYQRFGPYAAKIGLAVATKFSATDARAVILFPVTLRSTPDLSISSAGAIEVLEAGNVRDSTAIVLGNAEESTGELSVTTTGGTIGDSAWLRILVGEWIAFDAEL